MTTETVQKMRTTLENAANGGNVSRDYFFPLTKKGIGLASPFEKLEAISKKNEESKIKNSERFFAYTKSKVGLVSPFAILSGISPTEPVDEHVIKNASVDKTVEAKLQNGTLIPEFKPAIIRLDNEGNEITDSAAPIEPVVPPMVRIDNSAIIAKYPKLSDIANLIYGKNLDVQFTEVFENYIGAVINDNGVMNPMISFWVDFTEMYITKDHKFILNAQPNGYAYIPFVDQAVLSDYLDKKYMGNPDSLLKLDMFTHVEKEVDKLVTLVTLPVKSAESRKAVIDLLISDGFQSVFAEALKEDQLAHFEFSYFKSTKNFKLTSKVNKTIIITYDSSKTDGNVKMLTGPLEENK